MLPDTVEACHAEIVTLDARLDTALNHTRIAEERVAALQRVNDNLSSRLADAEERLGDAIGAALTLRTLAEDS